jgi:methyl-accepting chemotaxis protein
LTLNYISKKHKHPLFLIISTIYCKDKEMDFFYSMQLKWKLIFSFLMPILLVIAMSVVIYKSVNDLIQTSKWVNHTHEAIGLANDLGGSMVDMETGLRGYLVAGQEAFLEPYTAGQASFAKAMGKATKHVSDNATQVGRLDQIQSLSDKWLNDHAKVAIDMRKEVALAADATATFTELSSRTVGKEMFDGFRLAIANANEAFLKSNDVAASSLVQSIIMDMVNQETGQRGFLLSGQEASLEPFIAGGEQLTIHADDLRTLMSEAFARDVALKNVKALETLMRRWLKEVARVGISIKKDVNSGRRGGGELQTFINKGTGKQFFDKSRVHIIELQQAFEKSNHLLALGALSNASKGMVDMETGYRGFLLTGQQASLAPYIEGQKKIKEYLAEIKGYISSAYDVETTEKSLSEALILANNWRALAAEPEIEARREMNKYLTTLNDVTDFVKQGIGKKNMDALRGLLNQFSSAERELIEVRNASALSTANQARGVTLFGALAVVVFGLLITFFLTRNVLQQLGADPARVKEVADAIADGDLSMNLDTETAPTGVYAAMVVMRNNLAKRNAEDQAALAINARIKQALDAVSANVMVADANQEIIYLNNAVVEMFRGAESGMKKELPDFSVGQLKGSNISVLQKGVKIISSTASTTQYEVGGHIFNIVANPVMDQQGELIGTVIEWTDRTKEVAIEKEVEGIISSAQLGDLNQRMDLKGKTGFFSSLSQGMNQLLDVLSNAFEDVAKVMDSLAKGDLQHNMQGDYSGVFGQVKGNVNETIVQLRSTVGVIRKSVDEITTISGEIAVGNNHLSSRTEQQAASLEQTAAAVEELTSTVRQNADNAKQANNLSSSARETAEKGGEIVSNAVEAMDEISRSSNKIAEIIGAIDEIAFQTNLLALNASVEAARAGEQGRGFAVVATEVRNLAQRSAASAREIKNLIQDSAEKVSTGVALVNESGEVLNEIVDSVREVGSIVAEISSASQEQTTGIDQVNISVTSIDELTQQNAALAEEASAASSLMSEQAKEMSQQVDFFKIGNT